MREWTDLGAARNVRVEDHAEIFDDRAVVYDGVHDAHAGVDLASNAYPGGALEVHTRFNDRVGADGDVGANVRRRWIDNRHAGRHQGVVLRCSQD